MSSEKLEKAPNVANEAIKLKEEGNAFYRNGKYKQAIASYDKAIEKCSELNKNDLAAVYQNRAAACEMLKMWPQVKEDCTKALELNTQYVKAYLRRARAHEAENNLMDCLEDATAAFILEKIKKWEVNDNTGTYMERVSTNASADAARKLFATREPSLPPKSFIKRFFTLFVSDPLDKPILEIEHPKGYIKAKIALDFENYNEVIPACTEEINSNSTYKIEATLLRGTFYILEGNFEKGRDDLDAVINDSNADASLRANALIKRGRHRIDFQSVEIGLNDFNKAEKVLPDNPDVHFHRGLMYTILKRPEDASVEFGKVLKLVPNHADAYVRKCGSDFQLASSAEEISKVKNEIKVSVEKFPDFPGAYHLVAQMYMDERKFEEANELYEKAISRFPKYADMYVYHGNLLIKWRGDTKAAIELMNKAIEMDENCTVACTTLATIEIRRGNANRGIALLDRAIALEKVPAAQFYLFKERNEVIAERNCRIKLGLPDNSSKKGVFELLSQVFNR